MNRLTTAREAFIAEALGDVALLLNRVDELASSMEAGRLALAEASSDLAERLRSFDTDMTSITQRVQARAVEHIVRRSAEAARLSDESRTRGMNEAVRQVIAAEVHSALQRLGPTLQLLVQRLEHPRHLWLTHAATAAVSASLAWLVAGCGCR
jgi:hypothetical protein